MRLKFPGHFCPLVHGTRRLTLSPTSYSGRARSSTEKNLDVGLSLLSSMSSDLTNCSIDGPGDPRPNPQDAGTDRPYLLLSNQRATTRTEPVSWECTAGVTPAPVREPRRRHKDGPRCRQRGDSLCHCVMSAEPEWR